MTSIIAIFGDPHYAWFVWSSLLFASWAIFFFLLRSTASRHEMLLVSLWTMPLGFTEPLFVPSYWNPPSLFNLAQRTGFDIESVIFSFAIGGIASILYEFTTQKYEHMLVQSQERRSSRHRFHAFILPLIPLTFVILHWISNLHNLHVAVITMLVGSIAIAFCRPDLVRKMMVGSLLMTGLYFVYFQTLILAYPGYVERVWNLPSLIGIWIGGVPLDELLFALTLGALWSGLYEHTRWLRLTPRSS